MIRCIVWRLLFEVCNIKRFFGHGSERVQYLAFGANLSEIVLKRRRITPFASEHFTLRDYGLRFDHPSRWVGCGYASAEPAPGESLHGYLYTLSARDAARMDFYEVVPVLNRYRRTFVEQDGVKLYFYQTNYSTPDLSPSTEYLGYIIEGLNSHPDVEVEYGEAIAATETVEPGKFVLSYLWPQPKNRSGWLSHAGEFYQNFVFKIFLEFLYKYSLTVHFIRHNSEKTPVNYP
jgi:hypothetical protein